MLNPISQQLITCFKKGHQVLICGNGGSASLSDHFAGELLCKMTKWRKPLAAIPLTNPTVISAIANDIGYFDIFARQVLALGHSGDILITMSTSGQSINIQNAITQARGLGLEVIQFPKNIETGLSTPKTQELHLMMIHEISQEIEDHFSDS